MPLVELTDVTRTYNNTPAPVHALRGINLELDAGEFVALMGPSGSGKSTLLAVLGAMNPPTAGAVRVDDLDVYQLGAERLADFRREYLGFVFQSLFLLPYLTAVENVMLPLAAARLGHDRQRRMADEALERVGLGQKTARLPRDLSGGEQQRVAIARAVVNSPPLLLADEPTGCLDSATGRSVMELFQRLQKDGLTIFMVTHDHAIASFADRAITLRDGRIVPSELDTQEKGASQCCVS